MNPNEAQEIVAAQGAWCRVHKVVHVNFRGRDGTVTLFDVSPRGAHAIGLMFLKCAFQGLEDDFFRQEVGSELEAVCGALEFSSDEVR